MTTIAERKKIAKWILSTNDDVVIDKIKSLLTTASKKAREKYIERYNKEIDAAVKRIENGQFYTHEEVEAMLNEWQKETSAGIKKRRKAS